MNCMCHAVPAFLELFPGNLTTIYAVRKRVTKKPHRSYQSNHKSMISSVPSQPDRNIEHLLSANGGGDKCQCPKNELKNLFAFPQHQASSITAVFETTPPAIVFSFFHFHATFHIHILPFHQPSVLPRRQTAPPRNRHQMTGHVLLFQHASFEATRKFKRLPTVLQNPWRGILVFTSFAVETTNKCAEARIFPTWSFKTKITIDPYDTNAKDSISARSPIHTHSNSYLSKQSGRARQHTGSHRLIHSAYDKSLDHSPAGFGHPSPPPSTNSTRL